MRKLQGNPWAVLVTLCLGFFMVLLDTTIVNIAIPSLTADLGASFDEILWIVNAYTLVFAALLLVGSRLGDVLGRRSMLITGVLVFTVASLLCGLAQTSTQLIGARALQGVGGMLLLPQTLALITMVFPREKRGTAFGVWSGVAGLAPVAGPIVGGVLVDNASWRWIFYVNVPIGIAVLALAVLVIPATPRIGRSIDPLGALLSTAGLTAVIYALIEGERYDWGRINAVFSIPLLLGAGLLLLALFVADQWWRRDRNPLLPLGLFAGRDFSVMAFVTTAVLFSVAALLLPLTLYLQSVLDLSPMQAGLVLAPPSIVQLLIAPFAGKLADRVGGKFILFGGLVLFAAGFGILAATAEADSSRLSLMPGLLIAGVGMGAVFAPMNTLAMRGVTVQMAGAASGVISLARQFGSVLGGAAVGALLQSQLSSRIVVAVSDRAGEVPPGVRDGFVAAMRSIADGSASFSPLAALARLGIPEAQRAQVGALAAEVFGRSFAEALRPTLLLPIATLVVAALLCLLLSNRDAVPAAPERPETEDATEPATAVQRVR
ncbi:DHA2 family efflux MFS transporter permease subunit [Actinoplanes hulinensis]|uniref:DHA2 family efflux MFS transporter permease subunit n=1 Tax=Actinoplanes hulinensis TaxID=1144547 RepID=A0ABS7B7Q4_9ACTN|nr:DHA2 family efflux MFS transporter permease subunit [Actinoplanes hulinensis]MBW6437071.1 DHA2 family efflux MFS transporter permease subunit [Actinoplanes hulinensis]